MYLEPGHYITLDILINDTRFVGNQVRHYDKSDIAALVRKGEDYTLRLTGWPKNFSSLSTVDEAWIARQLTVLENGQGGGICLNLFDIHIFTISDIVMQNVVIDGNEADVGGSILCRARYLCVMFSGCDRRHLCSVFKGRLEWHCGFQMSTGGHWI